MNPLVQRAALLILLATVSPAFPQTAPAPPPAENPPHDIEDVDVAPAGGSMSVPLPEKYRRRLRKYEIPELEGSRQAIGSQLIDGRLPNPLLDYMVFDSGVQQRISIFEGGLVVIRMAGAGGTIQKRVVIPEGAQKKYLEAASATSLRKVQQSDLSAPTERRIAFLRIYDTDRSVIERHFDPSGVRSRVLHDQIAPIEDLLRALSEDRQVTSTIAGYEPKVGDELVGDDRKTYRVERIISDSGVIQLRCTTQPTVIYVAKKDFYNYFVGRAN